jgi:hypothetical protein
MPNSTLPNGPHGAAPLLARDPEIQTAERKTVIAGLTALQTILAAAGSAIAAAIGWYAYAHFAAAAVPVAPVTQVPDDADAIEAALPDEPAPGPEVTP